MLAYFKLGRVDRDRHATRACVKIVARQGPLAALVELSVRIQCQRMGRDNAALAQRFERNGGYVLDIHDGTLGRLAAEAEASGRR